MTRNQLIEQSFGLRDATPNFLLLLRVVLDIDKKNSSLESDIYDLFQYPERLEESYRDEWRSWIKNTLHKNAFHNDKKNDAQSLMDYLDTQYLQRNKEIKDRFTEYSKVLEKVVAIQQSGNVKPFKSKLKSNLELLML